MVNTTTLSGYLTRDIELRSTATGFTIGFMCIAVNDRQKNKQTGEWEGKPYFFDVKLLGSRAEKLAPRLTKGTKIFIQGKLEQERWEDKEGNPRSRVNVVIDDLDFASRKEQPEQPTPAEDAPVPATSEVPF